MFKSIYYVIAFVKTWNSLSASITDQADSLQARLDKFWQ